MKCQIYQIEKNLPLPFVNNDNWNRLPTPNPPNQNEAKLNCRPKIAVGLRTLQADSGCKHAKQKSSVILLLSNTEGLPWAAFL